MREGKNRDRENDDGAGGVEHHDEAATVFAINDDTAENHQDHRGKGSENG